MNHSSFPGPESTNSLRAPPPQARMSEAKRPIQLRPAEPKDVGSLKLMLYEAFAIRSFHESEDSNLGSYVGLFESYVNVDASDPDKIIELARSDDCSQQTDSIDK